MHQFDLSDNAVIRTASTYVCFSWLVSDEVCTNSDNTNYVDFYEIVNVYQNQTQIASLAVISKDTLTAFASIVLLQILKVDLKA